MRFYAERPDRLALQMVADLLAVAWAVGWVWVALDAREQVLSLQGSGEQLVDAGGDVSRTFSRAADTAGRVPFVGDELAGALGRGTGAGRAISDAGRSQVEAVAQLAFGAAVAIVVLAVIPVLTLWLFARVRYARAAAAAAALRTSDSTDLLALRALAGLPPRRLLRLSADPARAWRDGDAEVVDRLASLQLAQLGLRPRCGRRPTGQSQRAE